MAPPETYRFSEITVEPASMRVFRGAEELALEPKSLRLLLFLIENPGRLVSKEELLQAVWQDTFVADNSLTRAIAQIRKALGDDAKQGRYIETVPKLGYRFIADLEPAPNGTVAPTPPVPAEPVARDASHHTIATPHRSRFWLWAGTGAAVAAIAVAAWLLRPKPVPPMAATPVSVPLTSYRGSEESPAFSPDGNQVAFVWDGEKQENIDIYAKVMRPDATPLRLTTDPAPDILPAWSPDGGTIAFGRVAGPDKIDLMLIPALGGPERRLAQVLSWKDGQGLHLAWSENSKWLVTGGLADGGQKLFRISVESGESIQMTRPEETAQDGWPAISPDGRTLLFTRWHAYSWGGLYRMRIDENAKPIESPQAIPAGETRFGQTAWTADGKEIIARTPAGIVRLPAGGMENPPRIAWLPSNAVEASVSRRGDRMAYSLVRGDSNVWRIDLTAKTLKPERLVASTSRDAYPQYSPDGRRLAFYSSRSGSTQVWVSDADGKNARQLTPFEKGFAGTPHWSPDGRTIAFDSNRTGSYQVYTIGAEGGQTKQLTQGPAVNFGPVFSSDGRWMYFTSSQSGRNEVWKMPGGGGTPVQVTRNGGVTAVESEDGRTVYFTKEAAAGSIWKMRVDGGQEEQLTDSLYRTNFRVMKRGIYYMSGRDSLGNSQLRFYDFATKAVRVILPMGLPEFGLDVSPDGRYLIYDQLDDPASDLMLVEGFR